MGASAAKLLVYYHPDAPNAADQERLVADVAADCRAVDLALFVEPLSFSIVEGEALTGEARRRVVVETARRLTAIGGDVLKAEFPYDPSVPTAAWWQRGLRGTRRGIVGAVGPPVGRRRRGNLRGAGLRPPARRARAASSSVGPSGRRPRRWSRLHRDAFLATTGRERLRRLADLVDVGRPPWHDRPSRLTAAPTPGDGWYRDY